MTDRIQRTYDTVAATYTEHVAGELVQKPIDRALLAAFAELVGGGPVVDVGCGPGHVTAHLASLGVAIRGLDLSPAMVAIAQTRAPGIEFTVGSMTAIDAPDGARAGAIAFYSIIHLDASARAAAYRELARVIGPGGWLLVAFHVSSAEHPSGDALHLDEWWGHAVDLDAYFLAPREVQAGLIDAGFAIDTTVEREPIAGAEYPSRRCYLLARRA